MSGYRPWMSGAVAAAKRIDAAVAARHRAERYEEYKIYASESRACGYEVESFAEWNGEANPREAAEDRLGLYNDNFDYDRDLY